MSKPFDDVEGDVSEESTGKQGPTPTPGQGEQVVNNETNGIFDLLTSSTGSGSIQEYKDSPLNPEGDEGLAQVIRGFSGLVSQKIDDFALLDIGIGAFKFLNQNTGSGDSPLSGGGDDSAVDRPQA